MTHYFAPTVQQLSTKKCIIHRQQPHDEPWRKATSGCCCTRTSTYCSGKLGPPFRPNEAWLRLLGRISSFGLSSFWLSEHLLHYLPTFWALLSKSMGTLHRLFQSPLTGECQGKTRKARKICFGYFKSQWKHWRNLLRPLKVLPGSKSSRCFGWKHSFRSKNP